MRSPPPQLRARLQGLFWVDASHLLDCGTALEGRSFFNTACAREDTTLNAAKLGAEPLAQRLDELCAQRRRVVVGERPVGRLEDERERDRLVPGGDLLAPIDVEGPHLAELRADRLARRGHERPGRHVL